MKNLFALILLIPFLCLSQDFQGKAYYMSKISVDKSWIDNPRFASRKGYLNDMLKRNTEKDYLLEFNSVIASLSSDKFISDSEQSIP